MASTSTYTCLSKEDKPKATSSFQHDNNDTSTTSGRPSHATNRGDFVLWSAFGLANPPLALLGLISYIAYYSRPIPFQDLFVSIAFPVYLCFVNRFRFYNNASALYIKPGIIVDYHRQSWSDTYLFVTAIVGVLLPLLVQLAAPFAIAQPGGPHLYLLLCQIFWGCMARGNSFHPLPSVMLPIGFNTYRLFALKVWVLQAWMLLSQRSSSSSTIGGWETLCLVLALANAGVWTYNLFVVLLLGFLSRFLDPLRYPEPPIGQRRVVKVLVRPVPRH